MLFEIKVDREACYADRVFNSHEMKSPYRKLKQEMLPVSTEEIGRASVRIERFLDEHGKDSLNGLDHLKGESDDAKRFENYLRIYNHIFNSDVSLPDGVTFKESQDSRKILKEKLIASHKETDESIGLFGNKTSALEFNISDLEKAERGKIGRDLLLLSELTGRRNHREMKGVVEGQIAKAKRDSLLTHSDESGAKPSKEITHLYWKSEKIRTVLSGIGAYKGSGASVSNKFTNKDETKKTTPEDIIGLMSKGIIDDRVVKVSQLMFVTEVERTRATALTAAMFLDEVSRSKHVDFSEFPMSVPKAVDGIREINSLFKDKLPCTRKYDEALPSKDSSGTLILQNEGELFTRWLTGKGDNRLQKSLERFKIAEKIEDLDVDSPEPHDFAVLKARLKIESPNVRLPEEYVAFCGFIEKGMVVQALRQSASKMLKDGLVPGIVSIDKEILNKWYNIDAAKILEIEARSKVSTAIKRTMSEGDIKTSKDEPEKIVLKKPRSSSVLSADAMRASLSRSGSTTPRSRSASPVRSRSNSGLSDEKKSRD